ncbi:alpha-mannosidase [Bacillus sp. DJP31]|uniref:alpha-mannosidase n=1 Tax=Bacillus sp. DJP31 TaxID=3409789 RepID=UPI003BB6B377
MMEKRYTCYIVFQTHWDREWYLPFEVFRYRFTHVMDRIIKGLDSNEIKKFVLDGQMAALEDYLEVCEPEQFEKVKGYIKDERMIIGPWFVLADEFLVSGESLIRNLEIGISLAKKYGRPQQVGYLPDTFGHVGQMPQLLQGFGIDNAILWRGINPEQSEFWWKAPNGSEVLTVFLPEGYYQPLLNEEDYITKMRDYVEKVKPFATTRNLLLTNGGDHLMPAFYNMKERIQELNGSIEEVEFIEASYEVYLQSIREKTNNLSVYEGEMRGNEQCYVLPNVLSTRVYVKQQNQRVEDELVGYTEPLLTLASIMGGKVPHRFIEDTWKQLLLNHPHDSICGCSIDEVHDEMEVRTEKLSQRLHMLQQDALSMLGISDPAATGKASRKPFEDDSQFVVFNPHPTPFSGWIKGTIFLHEEKEFIILDEHQNQYEHIIINSYKDRKFESPLDAFPDFKHGTSFDVALKVENLASLSLTAFQLAEGTKASIGSSVGTTIENTEVLIKVEKDGTISAYHKSLNREYNGFLHLYSSLDAGDEYNYSPPMIDVVSNGVIVGEPTISIQKHYQRINYMVELQLPAGLNDDRSGASNERVTNIAHVTLEVFEGDSKIYANVMLVNQAKDQRLRLKFPLGKKISHSFSDSAFDVVKRETNRTEQFDAPKQKEVPVVVDPSYSFIAAEDFAFYHRGLQEYQVCSDSIEVTLLRSVGWLSRDDLRTRGGGAGPNMETPKAQCIGTYEYEFAFEVGSQRENHEIAKSAHQYRVPPRFYSGKIVDMSMQKIIELDSTVIQWSSIRVKNDKLVLRLWNPSEHMESFAFSSSRKIVNIEKVNFKGHVLQTIEPTVARLSAKEIGTYEITFKGER